MAMVFGQLQSGVVAGAAAGKVSRTMNYGNRRQLITRKAVTGTATHLSDGKFARRAATADYAAVANTVATLDKVALDERAGITGAIFDEGRGLATTQMNEVLNVVEAHGDTMTAT